MSLRLTAGCAAMSVLIIGFAAARPAAADVYQSLAGQPRDARERAALTNVHVVGSSATDEMLHRLRAAAQPIYGVDVSAPADMAEVRRVKACVRAAMDSAIAAFDLPAVTERCRQIESVTLSASR